MDAEELKCKGVYGNVPHREPGTYKRKGFKILENTRHLSTGEYNNDLKRQGSIQYIDTGVTRYR